MALVVLLRKPPEHGSIIYIRFRATVPIEEKEITVTVNGDLLRSPAVFSTVSVQHFSCRLSNFCWIVGIGDLENIHYSRVSSAPMNL